MDEPQVLPGQMIERPSADGEGIERIAHGEFISHRGELASYALGWSTASGNEIGRLTVGLGAGNEGGGSFHAVVFAHDDGYALGLVDEPFARVPEGGPDLTREAARAHECIDFVWWVADEALARDPRGCWLRHWLVETRAILTPEVQSGAEAATLVQHDDDELWQLIGDTPADGATGVIMHLWHLVDADPTLMDVLDLEAGQRAVRDARGMPWTRFPGDARASGPNPVADGDADRLGGLPPPWHIVDAARSSVVWRRAVAAEVEREIGPAPTGAWVPVAACSACDDVVLSSGDRFVHLHVTWSGRFEGPPTLLTWSEARRSIEAHEPDWA